ncbi:hypothetical protein GCM10007978_24340 [Shewanella hanedai]|uniref:Uncharacterized protein n=1 Tax=Shewanella hanedai TaxID=25 RepID=A0A553JN03_SHEHA|nr:hypothetical protein [Shewanella hanedai]TRY13848.1 hypothetical protein FN961_13095 [Shewanella hanedai]GGI85812.1 hypothetical protein GCM10007978_24340 [Shewanella hanedai]
MGKSDTVKETEYEKELAKVYGEQWNYYKENIVPVENTVIEDAKSSNDTSVYQNISDDSNLGYQRSFAQASGTSADQLAASGVNPNSGKFKGQMSNLSDMEASVSTDAKSRSQIAGQERYIDKMSNVMAMGQGEAQEAVASLNDIAVKSQRKAFMDADLSRQNKNNTLGAIGAIGGAAASYAMAPTTKTNTDFTLPANNSTPYERGA